MSDLRCLDWFDAFLAPVRRPGAPYPRTDALHEAFPTDSGPGRLLTTTLRPE